MFYKIYFWFYLAFSFLLLSTLGNTASFVLALSQLILLIALYSNGYKKNFFSDTFWKISFIYSILIGAGSMLLAVIGIIHFKSAYGLMVISAIAILTIPAYISLYIYVFKKRKIFSKINKPKLWKIYFWFLLVASIWSFYIVQSFVGKWDIIDLLISVIAILGLYAFCWNKKILTQVFWKIFFLITIIWSIILAYIIPPSSQLIEKLSGTGMTITPSTIFLFSTIDLILFLPLFLATYLYAFKNDKIWKKEVQEKK